MLTKNIAPCDSNIWWRWSFSANRAQVRKCSGVLQCRPTLTRRGLQMDLAPCLVERDTDHLAEEDDDNQLVALLQALGVEEARVGAADAFLAAGIIRVARKPVCRCVDDFSGPTDCGLFVPSCTIQNDFPPTSPD